MYGLLFPRDIGEQELFCSLCSAQSQSCLEPRSNDFEGTLQPWHTCSRIQQPPELCGVNNSGSLSGFLEKVTHLVMLFCFFPIILPIRGPMLTQRSSLLVFVGLSAYSATAVVGVDSLLPLSRDGDQTSFDKDSFDKMGRNLAPWSRAIWQKYWIN